MHPDRERGDRSGQIDLYVQPIVALTRAASSVISTRRRGSAGDEDVVCGEQLFACRRARGSVVAHRQRHAGQVRATLAAARFGRAQGRVLPALAYSLLDGDFFPELVDFLEENSVLGDSLIFQLSQGAVGDLGEGELDRPENSGQLGFASRSTRSPISTSTSPRFAIISSASSRSTRRHCCMGTEQEQARACSADEMASYPRSLRS